MLVRFSVLTLLAASVANAESPLPSLRLSFALKRSSMAVYGATSFDVYANPVVSESSASVSFDASVSFSQDDTTHNFLVVDGAAYHQVVNASADATSCLPPDMLPNVTDILAAFSAAEPVASVDTTQDISCSSGSWLTTTFAGETFVICENADADGGFEVFGEDLDVTVSYLNETVAIAAPSTAPDNCVAEYGAVDDSVSLSDVRLLWGASVSTSANSTDGARKLRESVSLASSSCACKSTPRPCLFFHGMDVEADGGLVDSYSFWGDIKEHAPCCSSFHFAILNTVDYEWYNDTLQQKACDMAMNVTALSTGVTSGSTTIQDTIIIAHSMGNNMLAGAVATGKCSIGSNVDWVDLAGPLTGSMGSDFLVDVCDNSGAVVSSLATLIGQCPGTTTRRSLVWDGGAHCSTEQAAYYAAAQAVHKQHVTAGMCGTQYSGLLSSEYLSFFFGGLILPHHTSKNDGVVEFPSCVAGLDESLFAADYTSTYYAAALNHGDMAFHNGEGLFSSAKKPLKWFECLL